MKRSLLFVLTVLMTMYVKAGDVTPEMALQQANNFLMERSTQRVVPGRSPGAVPQLKLTKQVNGLYVFNAEDDKGFVIVSNDDRIDAILGYADNGSFDTENIPENMQAWLQSCANQIQWMKENNITIDPNARRASAVKTAIEPLAKSHWDQAAPYNNQINNTTYFPYSDVVTGCVATAMAQAMYYTAKKAGLTSTTAPAIEIPTYKSKYGKDIPAIAASSVTLNWSAMRNSYTQADTDEGATAVASLMRCCGVSVEMDYANQGNGGSSSSTSDAADALKEYFGYDDETTRYIERSYFTYKEWIDILYHELSNGRIVIYDGQSSGSGHAFICDGYQAEDYFHINWGWGGKSDGYYKLALMNPYSQGIGGSSSKDGYHFEQGAVIGIKLDGAPGEIMEIAKRELGDLKYDIELNSYTFSPTTGSAVTDNEVTCTINVTNNGTATYDGDFVLYAQYDSKASRLAGKIAEVPAGETKDIVLKFTPKEAAVYKMSILFLNAYYLSDPEHPQDFVVNGSGRPTTDNLTLTRSLTIDNSELISGTNHNVFGTILKGHLTTNNASTTHDYQGKYQISIYQVTTPWTNVHTISGDFTVPANGSTDIPIEWNGMETGNTYTVYFWYYQNKAWTAGDNIASYTAKPAITVYHTDGTRNVTKPSGTSYTVPTTSQIVDLQGTGITSVTVSDSKPNRLFIIKNTDTEPAGATNIIKYDGSKYEADNIVLVDNQDFFTPVEFTVENIEFTYTQPATSADGSKGWGTIMLPFDVEKVTANGTEIKWFTSSIDTGKQFWLKEFSGNEGSTVNFAFASKMKANTPYIIALPGDKWGSSFDLSGKVIKFIGSKEKISPTTRSAISTNDYRFIGNTKSVSETKFYELNSTGDAFKLQESAKTVNAFRAYFKPDIFDQSVTSLPIGSEGGATGILDVRSKTNYGNDEYYDLQGHRVLYPKKGVYIQNGKKIIVK